MEEDIRQLEFDMTMLSIYIEEYLYGFDCDVRVLKARPDISYRRWAANEIYGRLARQLELPFEPEPTLDVVNEFICEMEYFQNDVTAAGQIELYAAAEEEAMNIRYYLGDIYGLEEEEEWM